MVPVVREVSRDHRWSPGLRLLQRAIDRCLMAARRGQTPERREEMNLFSKGTVLAGAAWALFACGGGSSASSGTAPASNEPAAGGDQGGTSAGAPATAENVKCTGVNECKGKSECAG